MRWIQAINMLELSRKFSSFRCQIAQFSVKVWNVLEFLPVTKTRVCCDPRTGQHGGGGARYIADKFLSWNINQILFYKFLSGSSGHGGWGTMRRSRGGRTLTLEPKPETLVFTWLSMMHYKEDREGGTGLSWILGGRGGGCWEEGCTVYAEKNPLNLQYNTTGVGVGHLIHNPLKTLSTRFRQSPIFGLTSILAQFSWSPKTPHVCDYTKGCFILLHVILDFMPSPWGFFLAFL